ncbi:ABC transporter permease [uncultured Nitratireductor sp.]|uniref:ABC transporter permease n=1 Tax=uncultured Nitratireductor sp. TaxID=520953 RepID=UPI002625C23B|nr:ABC transporter permease [uncultured Nitratireductor sp.]
MIATVSSAIDDLWAGLRMHRVWMALAQEDIGDQHRRTALGPLWLLINYLAFAGTFIFVIHRGDSSATNYAAYVATGLFVWFYIMEVITMSVSLFTREESFIKGTTLPLTVYAMRLFGQTVVRASYALLGCLAILLISGSLPTGYWLIAAAGIILILATTPAAILVFAFSGAYFPDSQFIVSNVMRIGMFLTPVFWTYEGSGGVRHLLYHWNPFTYFLETVRMPIVSSTAPFQALLVCAAISIGLWVLALLLLGKLRKEIVFLV